METLTKETLAEELSKSALFQNLFMFWFNDNNHIRSPFPKYIQSIVKQNTIKRAANWLQNLKETDKDKVSEDDILEKFEMILFEEGLKAVKTEDEKITLLYPFVPRIGDSVLGKSFPKTENIPQGKYIVKDRTLIVENNKDKYLKITISKHDNDIITWNTKIELP